MGSEMCIRDSGEREPTARVWGWSLPPVSAWKLQRSANFEWVRFSKSETTLDIDDVSGDHFIDF